MNQKMRNDIYYAFKFFKKSGRGEENGCPTWWFKFQIPYETKEIRDELNLMLKEGLVEVPYSRPGQKHWRLIK